MKLDETTDPLTLYEFTENQNHMTPPPFDPNTFKYVDKIRLQTFKTHIPSKMLSPENSPTKRASEKSGAPSEKSNKKVTKRKQTHNVKAGYDLSPEPSEEVLAFFLFLMEIFWFVLESIKKDLESLIVNHHE